MPLIRSSDIGNYLYCRRAWWYQRQGYESANQAELAGGAELHRQHGRKVMAAGLLRMLAVLFLLAALVLLTISLVNYAID
jgi:hypothetical protein